MPGNGRGVPVPVELKPDTATQLVRGWNQLGGYEQAMGSPSGSGQLFSAVDSPAAGGLATIDLDLARLESLDRLDRDPDVRKALVRIFTLALGGISGAEKK